MTSNLLGLMTQGGKGMMVDSVEYHPSDEAGDVRFDVGGPGKVQGAVRACSDRRSRVIATVCAWGDDLAVVPLSLSQVSHGSI